MDYAFKAGAQAVSLYTIAGLETPELRARFKQYSDSLRAVRAANGGKVPYGNCSDSTCLGNPCAADTNPFNNKNLMAVVERNIQRMVAGEPIHEYSVNGMVYDDGTKTYPALDLGEYTLVRENERIKVYNVKDNASGKTFDVLFIVYGDKH